MDQARGRRLGVLGGAAGVIGLLGVLAGGCSTYSNYPKLESARGVAQDPNLPTPMRLMREAVRYVATRYDPATRRVIEDPAGPLPGIVPFPMALSLPGAMRRESMLRVARDAGPEVEIVTPALEASADWPLWHVSRVWVRTNVATVDVFRPMRELPPGPDGKPVYQMITVRFEGHWNDWRVVHARTWGAGDFPVPTTNYLPEPGIRSAEPEAAPRAGAGGPPADAAEGPATTTTTTTQPTDMSVQMIEQRVLPPTEPAPGSQGTSPR